MELMITLWNVSEEGGYVRSQCQAEKAPTVKMETVTLIQKLTYCVY